MIFDKSNIYIFFQAGGAAGFTVDISLYPLDTLKTRLQSSNGFIKSGGFKNIYRGIGPAALGSAPNGLSPLLLTLWSIHDKFFSAALFFLTYENSKKILSKKCKNDFICHSSSASVGEMVKDAYMPIR